MKEMDEILHILPYTLRRIFQTHPELFQGLLEIRLRVGQPVGIHYARGNYFLGKNGTKEVLHKNIWIVEQSWLTEVLDTISSYSLYAFEEDMQQGYVTIRGGHRVGIAGEITMEGEKVMQIKHITFMNIRVARQYPGCARGCLPYITGENGILSTLLLSPPRCGKTTILRDLIRMISCGEGLSRGYQVGVVDERSELAACYFGIPQNDVGNRTDVLDGCPKAEGITMLLRAMAPEVIAVDEIGGSRDLEAVKGVAGCGVSMLATAHAEGMEELISRPLLKSFVEMHLFQRYILLDSGRFLGTIRAVYNDHGACMYQKTMEDRVMQCG